MTRSRPLGRLCPEHLDGMPGMVALGIAAVVAANSCHFSYRFSGWRGRRAKVHSGWTLGVGAAPFTWGITGDRMVCRNQFDGAVHGVAYTNVTVVYCERSLRGRPNELLAQSILARDI